MAFTGSAICTSFYTDMLNGVFDFATDTFRLALYDNTATLSAATTAYTLTGELATAGGYTAGGETTAVSVTTASTPNGVVVMIDFADVTWATATFTTRGALLYDDTAAGNPAIAVLDFGSNQTRTAQNFVVQFPQPTPNSAFIVGATVLTQ